MNPQAVINFKLDKKLKLEAQKVADELGVSLSGVLKNELRRLVADRRVVLDEYVEVPNKKTAKLLKQAQKDIEAGDVYSFRNNKEALRFLDTLK